MWECQSFSPSREISTDRVADTLPRLCLRSSDSLLEAIDLLPSSSVMMSLLLLRQRRFALVGSLAFQAEARVLDPHRLCLKQEE